MRPRDQLPYLEWESGGVVKRVYADAWESEDFEAACLVTENSVADGARIVDHVIVEPIVLSCRMFFSETPIRGDLDPAHKGKVRVFPLGIPAYPENTPLLSPAGITGKVTGALSAVGEAIGLIDAPPNPKTASALRFEDPPGRLREFLESLLEQRAKRTLFAVGLSVLRIESLALLNARIARTAADGDSGALDLSFRQLEFVSSETAEALPLPLEPRGQIKKGFDGKAAEDIPPGPKKSAAKAIKDSLTGG